MKILAIGDSWSDYPTVLLTGGGIPDHLAGIIGLPITNIAHHGDGIEVTLSLPKRRAIEDNLPADIIICSMGGDDIAGDQFCVWLNQNTDGNVQNAVNWMRLGAILSLIIADYEDLSDIRSRISPNTLIITHSYDFPPASMMGHSVLGLLGPWLKPGLD